VSLGQCWVGNHDLIAAPATAPAPRYVVAGRSRFPDSRSMDHPDAYAPRACAEVPQKNRFDRSGGRGEGLSIAPLEPAV
jgi:hypothetical protein